MRALASKLQRKSIVATSSIAFLAILSAAPPAWAQYQEQHRREQGNKQNLRDGQHSDATRRRDFQHNGHRMRLHDGRWHHWHGGHFRVAPPPLGFWLPHLPNIHRVWRSAGHTYYVIDNAWFRPAEQGGYIAIAAPSEPPVIISPPMSAPPSNHNNFVDDLYAYPKGTQTAARTLADKQECAQWSGSQVLADPWAVPYTDAQKSNYVRAFSACMEARNYVVR
jgi:hypothetical protein